MRGSLSQRGAPHGSAHVHASWFTCKGLSGLLYSVHCQMRYFPWAGNLSQSESTHQLSTRAELGQFNVIGDSRGGVQECSRPTKTRNGNTSL